MEELNNELYCFDCRKITKHNPKLSALMDGCMVCDECSRMNAFCTLTKVGDDSFIKTSKSIKWVEFNDNGSANELHTEPKIGYSLIMSPFNYSYTWLTTVITDIIEDKENYVHFKTENSEYILYYNLKNVQESK